ncbi:membrane progestin receptor alpha-B-like [Mizuhopecten yessoensis]|uniref:Membrane progestin receptor alpha-B n=1 Tax=Mizuhopecten yessoensis TaxID=6573 RepID=A0A210Q5I3_MIZYE|nr:membrane progestin receptor alpha-B-like [Mizuhopecten yessoensis]OWF44004.1 Membrane progestin receptor alpha-B [Mizuhopecten yessoensis]
MTTEKKITDHVNDFSDYVRSFFSEFLKLQPTLHRDDVHSVFHEPAIVKYYRPTNQPWRYYLISLFKIHNETGNVWTHLIGFIVMWVAIGNLFISYDVWTERHSWPMLVFGLCCMVTTMTSTCVHLLHSKSIYHHYSLFLIDYIGVTVYGFGTGIQTFYACSDIYTYEYMKSVYLPILTLVTWINFIVLCLANVRLGNNDCDIKRKLVMIAMQLVQGIVVTLPIAARYIRCYFNDTCLVSSLYHLSTIYIFLFISAFFFGSNFPEKLFPGKCDILGQGHQIFHVISVANQMWQLHSMRLDHFYGAADHTDPDIVVMLAALLVLLLTDIMSYAFLKKLIPTSLKDKKQS